MRGRVENRGVAVGGGERFRNGTFGQPSGFGQDGADRVGVEVGVAPGTQNGAYIENLEQVELEIADVSDVVPHCASFRSG